MHRQYLRATCIAVVMGLVPALASAADQTLVVTSFGGNWETAVRAVADRFVAANPGTEVVITLPGNSAQIMAKLRAEKSNPSMDVVLMGGGLDVTALNEALLLPYDYASLANYADLYEVAHNPIEGLGPSIGFAGVKLAYNTAKVSPPPTSWEELWNPAYKGKVGMMNMSNNGGIMLLLLESELNGGGIDNVDPGFAKLGTLKAQDAYFFESNPAAVDMFVQESIWISPMFDGRIAGLKSEGFPVDMTCPSEGCFVTHTNANIVAGSQNVELAAAFINEFMSAESQKLFAELSGSGPVNKKTVLEDSVAANVIYGAEEVAKLISLPWHDITPLRDAWVERWNREVLAQ